MAVKVVISIVKRELYTKGSLVVVLLTGCCVSTHKSLAKSGRGELHQVSDIE